MPDITIAQLVERSHALSKEKGWYETWPDGKTKTHAVNVPEKLVLIHSEVSEALEEYRNHDVCTRCTLCNGVGSLGDGTVRCPAGCSDGFQSTHYRQPDAAKPEGFVVELADVVIRVADLCGALGLNLAEAIEIKHAYNATREFRHGGKKC
jgi:hypothetical protein